jgi:hypothetical protein
MPVLSLPAGIRTSEKKSRLELPDSYWLPRVIIRLEGEGFHMLF